MKNEGGVAWLYGLGWACLAAVVLIVLEGIAVPRGLLLDFANFYDAGTKALTGETAALYDPNALIAGAEPFGHMRFFGTPISSYLYAPLAFLEPRPAAILFKVLAAACTLAAIGLVYLHYLPFVGADRRARAQYFALFALATMLFQPFWTVFQVGGQSTPLIFLVLVIAMIAYERGGYVAAALLMAAAVCVKPALAIGAVVLFVFAPNRFRIAALCAGAVAGLASVGLLGWPLHQEFLHLLAREGGASPEIGNSHMFAWLEWLLLGPDYYAAGNLTPAWVSGLALGLRLLVMAALFLSAYRLGRARGFDRGARNYIFISAVMIGLVYSPIVWDHYLAFLFVPLVHVIVFRRDFPRLALVMAGLSLVVAPLQNLRVLGRILASPMGQSPDFLVTLSFLHSLTMMLIVLVFVIFRQSYVQGYANPAWDDEGARARP